MENKEITLVDVDTLPSGWIKWSISRLKKYVKAHNYPKITIDE